MADFDPAARRGVGRQQRQRGGHGIIDDAHPFVDDLGHDGVLRGEMMVEAAALDAHRGRDGAGRGGFIAPAPQQQRGGFEICRRASRGSAEASFFASE